MGEYFERLAIYLIFFVFGIISIVIWIFNWICWNKKCCCFNFFGYNVDKVFVWWLSWVFLCGVLACCIAGFVTANRFGFAAYGIQCAYERIYYDVMYGQQKKTYPKWEGFDAINKSLDNLSNIISNLLNNSKEMNLEDFYFYSKQIKEEHPETNLSELFIFPSYKNFVEVVINQANKDSSKMETDLQNINNKISYYLKIFNQLSTNINIIKSLNKDIKNIAKEMNKTFSYFKSKLPYYKISFIEDFTYYIKVARAMGRIVPIIYFSLLLIIVVGSGALLITYYCKKVNQQFWILPMHITWNLLRFFMVSFFIYGCVYGMLFLGAKDGIGYLKYAFSKDNLNSTNANIIPNEIKEFFDYCIYYPNEFNNLKQNNILIDLLNDFVKNVILFEIWKKDNDIGCENIQNIDYDVKNKCNLMIKLLKGNITDILTINGNNTIENFKPILKNNINIFDMLNCHFIEYNINLMFNALWDLSWESRILCVLSCCIGFFGEIAVYGFLWTMYLWNRGENDYNNNNGYKKQINNKKNKKNNSKNNSKYNKIRGPRESEYESSNELTNVKNNDENKSSSDSGSNDS